MSQSFPSICVYLRSSAVNNADEERAISMNEDALPAGWVRTRLEDACIELIGGGTPSRKIPEYFGGNILWLTPTEVPKNKIAILKDSKEKITESGLKDSSARIIPKDSVLLTSRASIGYVAIAGCDVTTNQGFASFVCSNAIYNFFLAYWLWANKQMLESNATGTTFKEISKSKLREFHIPLPPLLEQRRIVTKLEELFTRLDAGVSELKKTQAQLKRYRQSVLKSACEGKLVPTEAELAKAAGRPYEPMDVLLEKIKAEKEKLVKEGKNQKGKPLTSIINEEIPYELPKEWQWVRLEDLVSLLGDGLHGTPKYSDHGDYFFINGNNLSDGKILINNDTKRASIDEYNKYKKKLDERTVLISINGTLGNVAFYNNEKIILGKSACYFNLLHSINKFYLKLFINTSHFLEYASKNATGSTIKNLSLKSMRLFLVPLPPLQEQHRIVAEVERRLSIADAVDKTVGQSLTQAKRLRSSILKRAFEGRLVAQDASDEPAGKLLERIRIERDKNGLKKGRKNK